MLDLVDDSKFRRFKKTRDESVIDPITNHIKRIIFPLACLEPKTACIVHAEE